jgi:hypothetical protein
MNHVALFILAFSLPLGARGAPFQNLDFESAALPVLPPNQPGGFVPIAQGLPGWSAFLGNDRIAQILHNSVTLGSPAVLIWGPDYSRGFAGRIDGEYTAVLFAGSASSGPALSISQTGTVPAEAQWLFFKALVYPTASAFEVSLNGERIPVSAWEAHEDYTVYGGDVSPFAGLAAELRFTMSRGLGYGLSLDSIVFAVPEPSGVGLFAMGIVAAVWWGHWQTRRRVA